jgi:hypothetical protein
MFVPLTSIGLVVDAGTPWRRFRVEWELVTIYILLKPCFVQEQGPSTLDDGLETAALIARKALRGDSESSTFCRWLHHVKIVLEPGAPPIAKAYLAVSHAFLPDSAIREVLQRAMPVGEKHG